MFKKLYVLIGVFIGLSFNINAQITKEFILNEKKGFKLVRLDFSSYKGSSILKENDFGQPLRVHAHLSKANILPTFTHSIKDSVLNASIDHSNVESESLGRSLSYRLFTGANNSFDHSWFIDLDDDFLYELNFNLGLGKASFDLSNLAVTKCKIKTASADVDLSYSSRSPNPARMDTMMIAIRMGSVNASRLDYSNAKTMVFDVNYGSVNLSFDKDIAGGSTISTVVGAGSVNIDLPAANLPFIVKLKSTPMCRTSVPKTLKEIGNKVYVSRGYEQNAENLMTFLIDISLGSVSLK